MAVGAAAVVPRGVLSERTSSRDVARRRDHGTWYGRVGPISGRCGIFALRNSRRCPGVGTPPPSCSRGACSFAGCSGATGPATKVSSTSATFTALGRCDGGSPRPCCGAGATARSGRPSGARLRCGGRSDGAPVGCCAERSPACGRGRCTRRSSGARATASRASCRGAIRCGSGPPPVDRARPLRPRPCPSATCPAGARSSPTTSAPPCRWAASRPRCRPRGGYDVTATRRERPLRPRPRRAISGGLMRIHLHTAGGRARCGRRRWRRTPGGLRYGRYSARFRAGRRNRLQDRLAALARLGPWPADGEIDFPEGNLNAHALRGFVHRAGAFAGAESAFRAGSGYAPPVAHGHHRVDPGPRPVPPRPPPRRRHASRVPERAHALGAPDGDAPAPAGRLPPRRRATCSSTGSRPTADRTLAGRSAVGATPRRTTT